MSVQQIADDSRYIDRSVAGWRTVAVSAICIIATLLGSWATHSVTREELQTAIAAERTLNKAQLDNIYTRIDILQTNVDKTYDVVRDMQKSMSEKSGKAPSVVYRYPVYTPGEKGTPGADK